MGPCAGVVTSSRSPAYSTRCSGSVADTCHHGPGSCSWVVPWPAALVTRNRGGAQTPIARTDMLACEPQAVTGGFMQRSIKRCAGRRRVDWRGLCLGFLIMTTSTGVVVAGAAPANASDDSVRRELSNILRAYISARNSALLAPGKAMNAFRSPTQDAATLNQAMPALQVAEAAKRKQLEPSRTAAEMSGVKYYRAATSIKVKHVDLSATAANVTFDSSDSLYFGSGPDDYTGQVAGWTANFRRVDGAWLLNSLAPDSGGFDDPINEPLPAASRTPGAMRSLRQQISSPTSNAGETVMPTGQKMTPMAYANRRKVAAYALKYATSPSSNYRFISSNDCTNFVSQALRAGGWYMKDGKSNSEKAWYYRWRGLLPDEWAHSWTVANHFYNAGFKATVPSST